MNEQDMDKFWSSFVVRGRCWVWIRSRGKGGYGQISIDGKTRRAHRVAYELVYGVILTPDQFLHHKCRNKSCVNPDHLEVTSQLEHTDSAVFGNKEKTQCPHGHEYTPENTCWNRSGKSRECRTCKYRRIYRRRRRIEEEVRGRVKQLALKYQCG